METIPPWPRRKRLRLAGFEYRSDGFYFVAVCTLGRRHLFGTVRDGVMVPHAAGEAVHEEWLALPGRFPSLVLDTFTLMPNHVHGILEFAGEDVVHPDLSRVMGRWKSMSAVRVGRVLGIHSGVVWQRGYHDHIIQDNRALDAVRAYIRDNPKNWMKDRLFGTA